MPTASTSSGSQEGQVIRLDQWGPDVTGRSLGEAVRNQVAPDAPQVTFDCGGIESMSPSFADELFGKLSAKPLRPHIRVVNATADVLSTIRFAVQQRTVDPA